jgi:hypothetical protein
MGPESLEELLNLPRIHPLLRPLTFEEGMRRRPATVEDLIGHEKMAEIHTTEREARLKARKASRERARRRKAGYKAIQRTQD